MGELEPWIDENFVRSVWFGMGYQVNVKMIRDKFSGYETFIHILEVTELTVHKKQCRLLLCRLREFRCSYPRSSAQRADDPELKPPVQAQLGIRRWPR